MVAKIARSVDLLRGFRSRPSPSQDASENPLPIEYETARNPCARSRRRSVRAPPIPDPAICLTVAAHICDSRRTVVSGVRSFRSVVGHGDFLSSCHIGAGSLIEPGRSAPRFSAGDISHAGARRISGAKVANFGPPPPVGRSKNCPRRTFLVVCISGCHEMRSEVEKHWGHVHHLRVELKAAFVRKAGSDRHADGGGP